MLFPIHLDNQNWRRTVSCKKECFGKEVRVRRPISGVALFLFVIVFSLGAAHAGADTAKAQSAPGQGPIIYVMPNAFAIPGSGEGAQVMVDSAHNGKEPQVAKVYQELQHRKECQQFSENIDNKKADYFLLLQHGGGWGNRWAVSNREGNVLASGQSIKLGNSVRDACLAIAKDWQGHSIAEKMSR